jgi:hypothetical protein
VLLFSACARAARANQKRKIHSWNTGQRACPSGVRVIQEKTSEEEGHGAPFCLTQKQNNPWEKKKSDTHTHITFSFSIPPYRYKLSDRRLAAISVSHRSPLSSSFCLSYRSSYIGEGKGAGDRARVSAWVRVGVLSLSPHPPSLLITSRVSVANSKLGPSTIASTGQASWQKPQ